MKYVAIITDMATPNDHNLVASGAGNEEEITSIDLIQKLQALNTCSNGELLDKEYTMRRCSSIKQISNESQRQEQELQMVNRLEYIFQQLQPNPNVSRIKNRKYKTRLSRVLNASMFNSSLRCLDVIRLVAPHVPIKYNNDIFLDGYRFQIRNSNGFYHCAECKKFCVKYDKLGIVWIIIEDFQNNKHRCRTNYLTQRYKLRDMLIEHNLRDLVRKIDRKASIKSIVEADFRRIRNKYPGLEDDKLPVYSKFLKDRIRKYKTHKFPCIYKNLRDYMDNGHAKVMEAYAPDALCRQKVEDELILRWNGDDLLITNKESLKIFIESESMSADGTFKVTPHFSIEDKPCRIHSQVILIYAIYKYPVKITKDTKKKSWYRRFVSKSYLVAVACLTGKNQDQYSWLYGEFFSLVKKYNYNNINQKRTCIMDFEREFRKCVKNAFEGELQLSGEVFHHNKNIKQYISKNGCEKYYKRTYDSKKLHQPFPPNYNYIFRLHVEAMYNLQYFTAPNIEEFGIKLCMSLWWHLFKKYDVTPITSKKAKTHKKKRKKKNKPNDKLSISSKKQQSPQKSSPAESINSKTELAEKKEQHAVPQESKDEIPKAQKFIPEEMLTFLAYMMKCWLNLTTQEIHKIFQQVENTTYRTRYKDFIHAKANKLSATCSIVEWSVNGFYVKTNNLTEGKNLWIAKVLGICKGINVFMLNVMEEMSKNRVEHKQHQQQKVLSILQPKEEFRAKLNILENIEHKHLTFDQFLSVSEKLTKCKMKSHNKEWKDYFCPNSAGKWFAYPHADKNGLHFNHNIKEFDYNLKDKEIDVKPRNEDIDKFIKEQQYIDVELSSIKIPTIDIDKSTQILTHMHFPSILPTKKSKRKRKNKKPERKRQILESTKDNNKNNNTSNAVKKRKQPESSISQHQYGPPTKRRKICNVDDFLDTDPIETTEMHKIFNPNYPIFNEKITNTNLYDGNGRPNLLFQHNTRKCARDMVNMVQTEGESNSESSDSEDVSQYVSQTMMSDHQKENQTHSIGNGELSHKRQYNPRNNSILNVYVPIQTGSTSNNTTSTGNGRLRYNRSETRIKRKHEEKHTKYQYIPALEKAVLYNTFL